MRNPFASLVGVLLLLLVHAVQAGDSITWGLVNFSPANLSRTDLARALIMEKLTDYTHEPINAPIPRIVSEIKSGAHWCWAGAIKNEEREGFSYLSMPFIFTFPQRIIVRRDRQGEFAARSPLSLQALLQDPALHTSVARDRVYSSAIDALFKRYPPPQVTSSIAEAVQMLLAGRLDYVLEDAGVAKIHAQQLGQAQALVALSFKEMAGLVQGRVMCPKNEWGKKVIADINAVLRQERGSTRYRQIVEAYHDPDDQRALRQLYDDVFLTAE